MRRLEGFNGNRKKATVIVLVLALGMILPTAMKAGASNSPRTFRLSGLCGDSDLYLVNTGHRNEPYSYTAFSNSEGTEQGQGIIAEHRVAIVRVFQGAECGWVQVEVRGDSVVPSLRVRQGQGDLVGSVGAGEPGSALSTTAFPIAPGGGTVTAYLVNIGTSPEQVTFMVCDAAGNRVGSVSEVLPRNQVVPLSVYVPSHGTFYGHTDPVRGASILGVAAGPGQFLNVMQPIAP